MPPSLRPSSSVLRPPPAPAYPPDYGGPGSSVLRPSSALRRLYRLLLSHFGPQHWWPGEARWETMVGAVLTQNTSWRNAELALANLKRAERLAPQAMRRTRTATLARLIRPSGYYNIKALKLRALVDFLFARYGGDPAAMGREPLEEARAALLNVWGIGPETADSILLYAAGYPVFVIDAYTRRIMARVGLARADATYEELQDLFMRNLPLEPGLYNEYHALLVALGKSICRKRVPLCKSCPLLDICEHGQATIHDNLD